MKLYIVKELWNKHSLEREQRIIIISIVFEEQTQL